MLEYKDNTNPLNKSLELIFIREIAQNLCKTPERTSQIPLFVT